MWCLFVCVVRFGSSCWSLLCHVFCVCGVVAIFCGLVCVLVNVSFVVVYFLSLLLIRLDMLMFLFLFYVCVARFMCTGLYVWIIV